MQTHRGFQLLSHPAVVVSLALWLLNDHVLKARFGNWTTGKLSDVAAMIVFPALIAAVVEPVVSRRTRTRQRHVSPSTGTAARRDDLPILIGAVSTFVFFAAFNLWTPADAATEWVMGLAVTSTLTMDATDLIVTPVLVIPWKLWHTSLRTSRAWGRLIFLLGAATTMATSPAEPPITEKFSGSFVLDEGQPSVTIPISIIVDGKPVSVFNNLGHSIQATYLGLTDDPASSTEALAVVEADIESATGDIESSTLTIRLDDLSRAPAQVDWTIWGIGDIDFGTFFFGSDEEFPAELTFEAPEDSALPDPVNSMDIEANFVEIPIRIVEWQVSVATNATELALVMPSLGDEFSSPPAIGAATEVAMLAIGPGISTAVPIPSDCPVSGCDFSIWFGINRRDLGTEIRYEISLFDLNDGGTTVQSVEHAVIEDRQEFEGPPVTTSSAGSFDFDVDISIDGGPSAIEGATQFFQAEAVYNNTPRPEDDIPTGFGLSNNDRSQWALPVRTCCDTLLGTVWIGDLYAEDLTLTKNVTENLRFTVTTWRLEGQPLPDVSTTISPR